MKTYVYNKIYVRIFIAAVFIIAQNWKLAKCPSTEEWMNTVWYIDIMECYSWEEGRATNTPNDTDKSQKHHAKQNSPESKEQPLYHFTHMNYKNG